MKTESGRVCVSACREVDVLLRLGGAGLLTTSAPRPGWALCGSGFLVAGLIAVSIFNCVAFCPDIRLLLTLPAMVGGAAVLGGGGGFRSGDSGIAGGAMSRWPLSSLRRGKLVPSAFAVEASEFSVTVDNAVKAVFRLDDTELCHVPAE